ncbi:hypothetical protein COO60DRAFT_523208 [Scenedesmus sp. NREL 46B-D3]|nr:hypothetical protein COO60DRAFT_523208 [Scenedesmus sp. NREL 46B-D3]
MAAVLARSASSSSGCSSSSRWWTMVRCCGGCWAWCGARLSACRLCGPDRADSTIADACTARQQAAAAPAEAPIVGRAAQAAAGRAGCCRCAAGRAAGAAQRTLAAAVCGAAAAAARCAEWAAAVEPGWEPGCAGLAQLAGGVGRRACGRCSSALPGMEGPELLQVAQALVVCGHSPDEVWCESFLAAARPLLPSLMPHQLASLAAALAALDLRPGEPWPRSFFTACPARGLRSLQPKAWPGFVGSLASLKLRPDASWLREMYAACAPALPRMEPGQLAQLAAAAAAWE